MMEKLGIPQTHLGLKEMIKQVDEDRDGKISFREVKIPNFEWFRSSMRFVQFLLIFRRALTTDGERENEKSSVASAINKLYAMLVEIDVHKEGVGGAKSFFEAKVVSKCGKYSVIVSVLLFFLFKGRCN